MFREPKSESSLVGELLSIWIDAADREALRAHRERTVVIDPEPIGTLDFHLDPYEKDYLTKAGRAAALRFLVQQQLANGPTAVEATNAANLAHEAHVRVTKLRRTKRLRRSWGLVVIAALTVGALLGAQHLSDRFDQSMTIDRLVTQLESCAERRDCLVCKGRGSCQSSAANFIDAIRSRPTTFILCPGEEQRVRKAADFLGPMGVDELILALRNASQVKDGYFGTLLDSTGDENLDASVSRVVSSVSSVFRRDAKHKFYCGNNAFLRQVQPKRYELILGSQFLWRLQDKTPAGDAAMYLVVAHEFSHALDFEAEGEAVSGSFDRRLTELRSDFMAGWFVARFLRSGNTPAALSDASFKNIVSFAHSVGGSESSPVIPSAVERHAAVTAGFTLGREIDSARAYAEAHKYVTSHFGTGDD